MIPSFSSLIFEKSATVPFFTVFSLLLNDESESLWLFWVPTFLLFLLFLPNEAKKNVLNLFRLSMIKGTLMALPPTLVGAFQATVAVVLIGGAPYLNRVDLLTQATAHLGFRYGRHEEIGRAHV